MLRSATVASRARWDFQAPASIILRGYHSGIHSAHTESSADRSTRTVADRVIGFVVIAGIVVVALAIGMAIGAAFGIR
jgi:hypothetical protein